MTKTEALKSVQQYFQAQQTLDEGEIDILERVEAALHKESQNYDDEIRESWEEFNKLEEHNKDPQNIDDFVEFNNKGRVTQIERILLQFIQY